MKPYLLVVDKGQDIAANDRVDGYTVKTTWDVYELHHLEGASK